MQRPLILAPGEYSREQEIYDRAHAAGFVGWGPGYLRQFDDNPKLAAEAYAVGISDRAEALVRLRAKRERLGLRRIA